MMRYDIDEQVSCIYSGSGEKVEIKKTGRGALANKQTK